jgi:hypothetical protein
MPLLPGLTTAAPKPPAAPTASAAPPKPAVAAAAAVAAPADRPAPGNATTAWGKSTQEVVRAPTLKEIQELEEADRRAREAAGHTGPAPGTTMASRIASNLPSSPAPSSNWGASPAAAKKPEPPAMAPALASKPAPAKPAAQAAKPAAPAPPAPSNSSAASSATSVPSSAHAAGASKPAASPESAFGKVMSPELRAWCSVQAPALGADMTLLEFCYSLPTPSEVQLTLKEYLGDKPQVAAFAAEFLARCPGSGAPAAAKPDAASADWVTQNKSPAASKAKGKKR